MYITGYSEENSWKIEEEDDPLSFWGAIWPYSQEYVVFLLFTPKINFKSPG